jgi:hypothetical protein
MTTTEKEGTTKIMGKNVFQKSKEKGKTNNNKEKFQTGLPYDPLITKRKNAFFSNIYKTKQKRFASYKSP